MAELGRCSSPRHSEFPRVKLLGRVALSGIRCPVRMGQSDPLPLPLFLFPGVVVWVSQPLWLWKGPISSESPREQGEGKILMGFWRGPSLILLCKLLPGQKPD